MSTEIAKTPAVQAMEVMVACAGDLKRASRVLTEEFELEFDPIELEILRESQREEYEKMRERFGPALERHLTHDMREVAHRCNTLERKLLDLLETRVDAGKVDDPAKALASVAKVKQTAVDKLLTLTGRPQAITEKRSVEAIVRALEARNVFVPSAVEGFAQEEPDESDG